MSSNIIKNIVVTGGNKGIGYGIIEGMLKSTVLPNCRLILTSRNAELGKKAIDELSQKYELEKDRLVYKELDIGDKHSQEDFAKWVKWTYGSVSTLVNNAGVCAKANVFTTESFDFSFKTNFTDTVSLTDKLINENLVTEKVVFITSSLTKFLRFGNKPLLDRFDADTLTVDELYDLAMEFRESIVAGDWEAKGWNDNCYGISKLCISHYCRILGMRPDMLEKKLQFYCCCPGWCRTDYGGPDAQRSVAQGVVVPLFLIELERELAEKKGYNGKFFYGKMPTSICKAFKDYETKI
jgi:NAD(P)-dependent dehydrogenase (short-subunit alcohol dehydrogenase family)